MDLGYINENLVRIRQTIAEAADKSGRNQKDITLLAVTKTVSVDMIQKALESGVTDIGENRVQELLSKYDSLCANWHLIGHLQKNKVKYIIDKVSLIHSVDSIQLAQEISNRAVKSGIVMDVLAEINIGNEQTKFGIAPENAKDFVKNLWGLDGICVKGLMTVAPYVDNGEKNRDLFKKMRLLFVDINGNCSHNSPMKHLSMGMTGDYVAAIEEGANIVRIGTGIFGHR